MTTDIQKTLEQKEKELSDQLEALRKTRALFLVEKISLKPEHENGDAPTARQMVKDILDAEPKNLRFTQIFERAKQLGYTGSEPYLRSVLRRMYDRGEVIRNVGHYTTKRARRLRDEVA